MDPARIFTESLTPRPELENSQGQTRPSDTPAAVAACPLRPRKRTIDCRNGACPLNADRRLMHRSKTMTRRAATETTSQW
jgi:hypothetical protein